MRKKNNNKIANRKKNKILDVTKPLITPLHYRNPLKPKTINQRDYIRTIAENTITFCEGNPGAGKTHIAVGMAIQYLLDEKIKKIVITRPIVEAGEKIGFLPGDKEEKLHPYLLPILDEVAHFISMSQYSLLKAENKIEICPLGLMRGRSFHNAFIVADECQNSTYDQLKMLLTRIGNNSKMVLTGDLNQSDLPRYNQGGFYNMIKALDGVDGVASSKLTSEDIIRNPIICKIISRLDSFEYNQAK